jgi:hypothetical protein
MALLGYNNPSFMARKNIFSLSRSVILVFLLWAAVAPVEAQPERPPYLELAEKSPGKAWKKAMLTRSYRN